MTMAERLRVEREKKGVTCEKVAKAIGASTSLISYFESGTKVPSVAVLTDIARYYGVSADYLLGLKEEK